jgi:hypothetical protein
VSGPERVGTRTEYEGKIATVRVDSFRYPDGSTAEREIVAHPGAVAVVAHDERNLYLVRQPREAVGEGALLELPAGKLDAECSDSKSLVGLLLFADLRRRAES